MDGIFHLLGLCGDNHSHADLIDILIVLGGGGVGWFTLKMYYKTTIYFIKDFFKKLINGN